MALKEELARIVADNDQTLAEHWRFMREAYFENKDDFHKGLFNTYNVINKRSRSQNDQRRLLAQF